jgi:hypothetical protein
LILLDSFVPRIRRRASADFALNGHSLGPRKEYQMDGANAPQETTRVTAPAASNTLGVNVFTAPAKAMVGERPKPFGEALRFHSLERALIFGEFGAVLVDGTMRWLRSRLSQFRWSCAS